MNGAVVSAEPRRSLRAKMDSLERKVRRSSTKPTKLYTVSHMVIGGIMLTYFVGVGIGGYAVLLKGEPLSVLLDFIMKLSLPVGLGYFVKAMGENICKIVFRLPEVKNESGV